MEETEVVSVEIDCWLVVDIKPSSTDSIEEEDISCVVNSISGLEVRGETVESVPVASAELVD